MFAASSWAADLAAIKARGEIRHIGIRYANFVTGAGDGLDVELMQGFAKRIGVSYKLVYSDFYSVIRDLLGKDVLRKKGEVTLTGDYPIKGDVISTGFTMLAWREAILLYSDPTLPSQVLLVAPAEFDLQPIKGGADLAADIVETRKVIGSLELARHGGPRPYLLNYGLVNVGVDLKVYNKSTNLNEMVPALLNKEAELSLLDVPDAILDLRKWAGRIKVLGPISNQQMLATAFPKDAPALRDEFNAYLNDIKASGVYDQLVDKYYPGNRRYFPKFFAKTIISVVFADQLLPIPGVALAPDGGRRLLAVDARPDRQSLFVANRITEKRRRASGFDRRSARRRHRRISERAPGGRYTARRQRRHRRLFQQSRSRNVGSIWAFRQSGRDRAPL